MSLMSILWEVTFWYRCGGYKRARVQIGRVCAVHDGDVSKRVAAEVDEWLKPANDFEK